MDLRNGDCLTLMKSLPDKSVDLMICDLPYGETNCKWDTQINMDEFWSEFKRIRKSKKTACIHFCSTKFGYSLIKSWEKGFKMDMVWKKRNKTGGLQSRHRPMRNHEMVYFFYEQAPKYNRDKYHKRIKAVSTMKEYENGIGHQYAKKEVGAVYEPPNPASVVEEETDIYGETKSGMKARGKGHYHEFEPPNPPSVLEEKDEFGWDKSVVVDKGNKIGKVGGNFEPVQPASVIEENTLGKTGLNECMGGKKHSKKLKEKGEASLIGKKRYDPELPVSVVEEKNQVYGKACGGNFTGKNSYGGFEPVQPASVVEEEEKYTKGKNGYGYDKEVIEGVQNFGTNGFEPPNPASVMDDYIIPADDEPVSMFESTKVFIGKRHHQTEKPQDILEFFIKYWTDEEETILDPTMGSGSTGVACANLNRKFIGFELDEKIFKKAKERIANKK